LVFNEGYSASSGGDVVRRDLCEESIRLARLLVSQLPGEPEPQGLLALMLLHHARAAARTTAEGEIVLLEHQDRSRWNEAMLRARRTARSCSAAGPRCAAASRWLIRNCRDVQGASPTGVHLGAANHAAQGCRERSYLAVWARPRTKRCDESRPHQRST